MPLPKTKHPLFETELPSTKKMVTFRQMLVSDEKILLMAKSSQDDTDIFRAVKQVVNNCMFDGIDNLTTFDIEWMFLKIRAASIGDTIELEFTDKEDEKAYRFDVKLDDVKIIWPELTESTSNLIKIDEELAMTLRYPPASILEDERAMGDNDDSYEFVASKCIDKIFEDEETYIASDYTDEELLDFIMNLNTKAYAQVKDFISTTPYLYYKIAFTNEKGTEREIVLTTLTDFFTFR